jgi:hypothetical protein
VGEEQIASPPRGGERFLTVLDDPVHLRQRDENLPEDGIHACRSARGMGACVSSSRVLPVSRHATRTMPSMSLRTHSFKLRIKLIRCAKVVFFQPAEES